MSTVAAIRIGPADNGRSMTLEEFMEAEVEEGFRYEFVRSLENIQVRDLMKLLGYVKAGQRRDQ